MSSVKVGEDDEDEDENEDDANDGGAKCTDLVMKGSS